QIQASVSVASVFQNPTFGQFTASLLFDVFTRECPVGTTGDGVEKTRLTYGQRQIWVEHNNGDAKTAYNIVFTIDIKGKFDVDALKQSLTIIADRHSMLRTGFVQDGSQILRILQEAVVLPIFEEECPYSASQMVADYIAKKIRLETLYVFSLLDAELPYRMTLIKVKELRRVLLINFHHILVDEWSLEIFFSELAEIYKALKKNSGQYEHTALTACYDDFCDWQNRFLKSADYCRQLDYWREELADLSPELSLPKKTALAVQSKGDLLSEEVFIPAQTITRLEKLASSQGTTLFTLLLSVYALTLAKVSRNTDLSIGTAVSLRDQSDFQTIIGYYLNTIVIRAKPKQGETFLDFLSQMHLTLIDAIRNKDVPLEVLAAELEPIRDYAGRPFFQTLFAIQRGFDKDQLIPDTDTSIYFHAGKSCKTDLALQFVTEEEGYLGRFEYDSSKFEPETISELRSVFESFIKCLYQGETFGLGFLKGTGKIKSILESNENFSITATDNVQETGDLKIALVRCWQKCLRLTAFDPNASFFDLGGNSILALQLVAEIEKSIGLHLDLQVIFLHKTFAAILEQCNESYASSGDLVVNLRNGFRSSTVFCIHGVTYYKDLAEVFPTGHNVVGLMSQSHQEIINNFSIGVQVSVDMQLLIDQYYVKVRQLQPEGPYYLVGHSFGGILAFEIASRLQKEGFVVERLILVDTLLPSAFHPHWLQKIKKLLGYVRSNMWSEMRHYVLGGVARKLLLFKDTIFGANALSGPQCNHVISKKIGSLYEDAMRQYHPSIKDYKGRVVLVRADETRFIHARKDDFGWQKFIEDPIEFVDVPGDHLSCVSQPNLDTLSAFFNNSAVFDQSSQS
ncbi:MAG: hypothetical protein JKY12_09860, partial [Sneathiella sp.]|nr:hypothetical protein [Sneathiella sp.]